MRIIGGEFRGRNLAAPEDLRIRPTADRIRESIFSILSQEMAFAGIRVMDLFAGTGALGLEAASRGAAFVLFVDNSRPSARIITANIRTLCLQSRCRILHRDATRLGRNTGMESFQLVFADPPYGMNLGPAAARALADGGWLGGGAVFVVEEHFAAGTDSIADFVQIDERRYGRTKLTIYRYRPAGREDPDDQSLR